MYDTLIMEVLQPLQNLGHIHAHQILRKLAEILAYTMETAILAILQDDIQTFAGLDEAQVLDDVVVVEVLEQVDFRLDHAELRARQVRYPDLLDGDGFAGAPVEGFVDGAEGAFAEAFAEALDEVS
jgi:hypothetical protein